MSDSPGAGPAVWLLAGNMLDPAVMFSGVDAPDGYAKVVYDWLAGPAPADHHSAAARLAGQLERGRPRPLILAGHSSGGVLAMLVTLRVPGRVQGLLLANTGAHMAGQRNHDIPARVRDQFGPELVAEFIDRCHARALEPGVRDTLIERALAGDPHRYLDAFASIRQIDLRPDLAAVGCPTMLVRGLRDSVRLPSHAAELASGIPGSEVITSDSGHCTPLEDPAAITRALVRLAARIASPPPRTPPAGTNAARP